MEEVIFTYRQELYHYGIKGMQWGVRRYQNKDGSLTPAGKKRYDDDSGDNNEESQSTKSRNILTKRNIAIGAAVAGAALATMGAMYVVKKNDIPIHMTTFNFGHDVDVNSLSSKDLFIPKGTKFHRVSSKSVEDYAQEGKRIYASYLREDAKLYKEEMPRFIRRWGEQGIISDDGKKAYEHVMKMNKDVKAPSKKIMAELYMKVKGTDKVDLGHYQRFMSNLNNSDNPETKKFFQYVKEMGYNAVIDENDAGNYTKSPLILLDPKNDIASSKSHRIRTLERVINVITM